MSGKRRLVYILNPGDGLEVVLYLEFAAALTATLKHRRQNPLAGLYKAGPSGEVMRLYGRTDWWPDHEAPIKVHEAVRRYFGGKT